MVAVIDICVSTLRRPVTMQARGGKDDLEGVGGSSVSSSLLVRLRARDEAAWERLVELYGPLVYRWCRRAGLQESDAADVGQEVFRGVATGMDRFRRDRPGDSFRRWLWTITRTKLMDYWRRQASEPAAKGGSDARLRMEQVAEGMSEEYSEMDTVEQDQDEVLHGTLRIVQTDFARHTWQAFWKVTVEGRRPVDVAKELGMSRSAVYTAKSRVLRRVREELDGLEDFV